MLRECTFPVRSMGYNPSARRDSLLAHLESVQRSYYKHVRRDFRFCWTTPMLLSYNEVATMTLPYEYMVYSQSL